MENLYIIGTSHISKQSVKEIKAAFDEFEPEILGIELDRSRLASLLSTKKQHLRLRDIFRIGLKGYFFALIGAWAEKKLGDHVGMKPGADMLAGVKLAQKKKIKIAFIDQDIRVTLSKLSKGITWKERWNFVVDIFNAAILRKKEVEFDLSSVPDEKTINFMISKVKIRYPNIYRILVEERNVYMADQLNRLKRRFPDAKILALVGAGHKNEMMNLITRPEPGYSYSYSYQTDM